MAFIKVDLNDFNHILSLLDEAAKDENLQGIVNKGLSEGFDMQQSGVKGSWSHENTGKPRKNNIAKKKTISYLLYDDTPLWRKDKASLGTGFLFNNSIPPLSPQAEGGIIAQYLAYGTTKKGKTVIKPDMALKEALVGKAIRDKVIEHVEYVCIEEFEKLLSGI